MKNHLPPAGPLRGIALCWLVVALVGCAAPGTGQRTPAAEALNGLFDAQWADNMQRYPEWATYVGDNRLGDRLADASPAAEAERYALERQWKAQALAIDPSRLDTKDRTSRAMFIHQIDTELAFEPLVGYRRMTLGALGGFHTEFADLLRASPTDKTEQVEQMLARMVSYPRRVDQELARLRQGLALGWVPPRSVLERVLEEQWRHRSQGLQLQASRNCCASIRQHCFSTLHRSCFSSFGSLVHQQR